MRGAAGCALPFRGRRTWCVGGRRRSAGGFGLGGFRDGGGAREDIDAVWQVAAVGFWRNMGLAGCGDRGVCNASC
jgi:hypothetical protein